MFESVLCLLGPVKFLADSTGGGQRLLPGRGQNSPEVPAWTRGQSRQSSTFGDLNRLLLRIRHPQQVPIVIHLGPFPDDLLGDLVGDLGVSDVLVRSLGLAHGTAVPGLGRALVLRLPGSAQPSLGRVGPVTGVGK